jgi:hypothetical protein
MADYERTVLPASVLDGLAPQTQQVTEDKGGTTDLAPEKLANLLTLEIEVQGDIQPSLDALNSMLGTAMQSRPDGFHITVISPTESGKIKTLTEEQIAGLAGINAGIQRGEGIAITGVGVIDGRTRPDMRAADRTKITSYASVEAPGLAAFRESIGLPPKDLHMTLGFEGGDIHMHVVGQDQKGKDMLAPIPKKPDPRFASLMPKNIAFGALSGQQKTPPKTG